MREGNIIAGNTLVIDWLTTSGRHTSYRSQLISIGNEYEVK